MNRFILAALASLAFAMPMYGCADEVNTGDLNTDVDADDKDNTGDDNMPMGGMDTNDNDSSECVASCNDDACAAACED